MGSLTPESSLGWDGDWGVGICAVTGPEVIPIIGLCESAYDAYKKLKARYEGKQ